MASEIRNDKPLALDAGSADTVRAWAREGYPEESCGVFVGRDSPEATVVRRAIRVANVSPERRRDRYALDPEGFLSADLEAQREGLEIVGVWHTHPDHPARPSRTDLDAAWEGYSYLIVSVAGDGATELAAWRLHDGQFHEQPIAGTQEADTCPR